MFRGEGLDAQQKLMGGQQEGMKGGARAFHSGSSLCVLLRRGDGGTGLKLQIGQWGEKNKKKSWEQTD